MFSSTNWTHHPTTDSATPGDVATEARQKAETIGTPSRAASLWQLARQSVTAWVADYAPSMGAALAYYTLFSIAPLLLLVIAVAGVVFGADAARGQVVAQLGGLIGHDGATAVQGLLNRASQPEHSAIASLVSIVTLFIGATSVFAELQSDLDRIWRAPETAKTSGLWGMLRTRVLSFGLVVSIGFLMLVSLVVSAGLAALATWWGPWFEGWLNALQIVNQAVSLMFVTVLFAMMYRILPSVRVGWQDVWYGALATGILFTVGKFAIGMYLGKAGVPSGFGAAGSLVVLLVWVFYSSQIFLLGAEFTWLYAHSHGSRAGDTSEQATATAPQQRPRHQPGPPLPAPARAEVQLHPAEAETRPGPNAARDLATATIVWLGYGLVRSFLGRRRSGSRLTESQSDASAGHAREDRVRRESAAAF
jgi:membrane protein